jgi:hypothetical protein
MKGKNKNTCVCTHAALTVGQPLPCPTPLPDPEASGEKVQGGLRRLLTSCQGGSSLGRMRTQTDHIGLWLHSLWLVWRAVLWLSCMHRRDHCVQHVRPRHNSAGSFGSCGSPLGMQHTTPLLGVRSPPPPRSSESLCSLYVSLLCMLSLHNTCATSLCRHYVPRDQLTPTQTISSVTEGVQLDLQTTRVQRVPNDTFRSPASNSSVPAV